MVDKFALDWRTADLDESISGLLAHAERLTRNQSDIVATDIDELRTMGWSDEAISLATQIVAYFNYINRIAAGLGIDTEDWIDGTGRPLA
jgi:alkylhydroperoxidase family enzyme